MSWESVDDCNGARGAIKKYEDRQKALAEFDPSQKLDFDNLMAPVHIIGDQAKCVGCTVEAYSKAKQEGRNSQKGGRTEVPVGWRLAGQRCPGAGAPAWQHAPYLRKAPRAAPSQDAS